VGGLIKVHFEGPKVFDYTEILGRFSTLRFKHGVKERLGYNLMKGVPFPH